MELISLLIIITHIMDKSYFTTLIMGDSYIIITLRIIMDNSYFTITQLMDDSCISIPEIDLTNHNAPIISLNEPPAKQVL